MFPWEEGMGMGDTPEAGRVGVVLCLGPMRCVRGIACRL